MTHFSDATCDAPMGRDWGPPRGSYKRTAKAATGSFGCDQRQAAERADLVGQAERDASS